MSTSARRLAGRMLGCVLVATLAACNPGVGAQSPHPRQATAQQLRGTARDLERAGKIDSALVYYGRAIRLEDSSRAAAMARLLESSPLLRPSRSLPAEVGFIRDVKAAVQSASGSATTAMDIQSAEQGMAALEAMLSSREATIEVRHPTPGFQVEFRRWLYRNDPAALWTPLRADTTVTVPAAAFQFRYRVPGTERDTLVTLPCANGCRVPPASGVDR